MAREWESALNALPTGAAIVRGGVFQWVSQEGAALLGRSPRALIGGAAPFRPDCEAVRSPQTPLAFVEQMCAWRPVHGAEPTWLAYNSGSNMRLGDIEGTLVEFRDVTEDRNHHQRVTALGRTAANMASDSSLEDVLEAMAAEVQRSQGIAGTQIMIFAPGGDQLQIMGSAGFEDVATFFELLMAARDRGADLATHHSMSKRSQVVLPGRRARMLADPAWEPLHAYIAQLDWDTFVSTPLLSRGRALGALNVYVASDHPATPAMLAFLSAMADQAALAVDYATLIGEERISTRREERKRLARELHDSVVQHVFSIGMQAKALSGLARRLEGVNGQRLASVATEVAELVDNVQRDLRGVVLALQPAVSAQIGLLPALHTLAEGMERQYGVRVNLDAGALVHCEMADAGLAEDCYRIISEALHNACKHASPTRVRISAACDRARRTVLVDVVDDGHGIPSGDHVVGLGLTSMRDRAAQWGGTLTIAPAPEGPGTRVRAELPLPSQERAEKKADP